LSVFFVASPAGPWEEKIGNRLEKQEDHLFTFLLKDNVEPTNNRAERSLRPAVVHRKISCGNKPRKGADSWQVLASVITTAKQNNTPFSEKVEAALNKRLQR
jgi:transposase